jgi:hypothetical protein
MRQILAVVVRMCLSRNLGIGDTPSEGAGRHFVCNCIHAERRCWTEGKPGAASQRPHEGEGKFKSPGANAGRGEAITHVGRVVSVWAICGGWVYVVVGYEKSRQGRQRYGGKVKSRGRECGYGASAERKGRAERGRKDARGRRLRASREG